MYSCNYLWWQQAMDIYNVDLDSDSVVKSEDYDNWIPPTQEEILAMPSNDLLVYFKKLEADYDLLEDVWHESPDPVMSAAAEKIVEQIYPTFRFIDALLYNRNRQDALRQTLRELDKLYAENQALLEKYQYAGNSGDPDRQYVFHLTIKELVEVRRFSIEQQIRELDDVSV